MPEHDGEDDAESSDEDVEEELFGEGVRGLELAEEEEEECETTTQKLEPVCRPKAPPRLSLDPGRQKRVQAEPRRHKAAEHRAYARVEGDETIVSYDGWLSSGQEYSDDLKFVNDDRVVFDGLGVEIEQDRRLGKAGMVWDGAFVLAEALVGNSDASSATNVLELGAGGTGLCSLALSKRSGAHFLVTDGEAAVMPLLHQNIRRNAPNRVRAGRLAWRSDDDDDDDDSGNGADASDDYWHPGDDSSDCVEADARFDLILAAECVAPIYDPRALLDTLGRHSTPDARVWLVVKRGRWPEHADAFCDLMRQHFDISVYEPQNSRLRAKGLYRIIQARLNKKKKNHELGCASSSSLELEEQR